MPKVTGPLLSEGAIIEAQVGLSHTEVKKLRQAFKPVQQPKQIRFLIDSGAETTCLDSTVIKSLGLAWSGPIPLNIPALSGWTLTSLYRADVTIVDPSGKSGQNFVINDLAICELSLGLLHYEGLIGRDILDQVRFNYEGPSRTFILDWT